MDAATYPDLLPPLTDLNRSFWDGCRDGELRLQHCKECRQARFPESYVCPNCLSAEYSWEPASGRGRLWSWIVMHQRYFPAFADELPYNVAFVRLDEGPYLMTSLVEVPDDLRIDEVVEVTFVEVPGDRTLPKFRVVR